MADNFDLFCGTRCHNGFPDCRVSGSLYNHRVMVTHDTNNVKITMDRAAGIIFNQTSVESTIGKCAYLYDGQTFNRVNHGCGCPSMHPGSCDAMDTAYRNQDCEWKHPESHSGPIPGTCKNNTEISPDVDECWCKSSHPRKDFHSPAELNTMDQQCFFKSGGLIVGESGNSELHEFVKARIASQSSSPTETRSGATIHRIEQWNELVVDAGPLVDVMRDDVSHGVLAFMYVKGVDAGKKFARQMQQEALGDYGGMIPIVEIDTAVDVRCRGPFNAASSLPTTTTTRGGCRIEHEQCGGEDWQGETCCAEGLTCYADNQWYAACKKNHDSHIDCCPRTH